jgi:hypothetical protein
MRHLEVPGRLVVVLPPGERPRPRRVDTVHHTALRFVAPCGVPLVTGAVPSRYLAKVAEGTLHGGRTWRVSCFRPRAHIGGARGDLASAPSELPEHQFADRRLGLTQEPLSDRRRRCRPITKTLINALGRHPPAIHAFDATRPSTLRSGGHFGYVEDMRTLPIPFRRASQGILQVRASASTESERQRWSDGAMSAIRTDLFFDEGRHAQQNPALAACVKYGWAQLCTRKNSMCEKRSQCDRGA